MISATHQRSVGMTYNDMHRKLKPLRSQSSGGMTADTQGRLR